MAANLEGVDNTADLSISDKLKLSNNISKSVKTALGDKQYDGSSRNYRPWFRTFASGLNLVNISGLDAILKEHGLNRPPPEN